MGMVDWAGDPAVLTLTAAAREAVEAIEQAVEPTWPVTANWPR